MAETRERLGDKVEMLLHKFTELGHGATEAISGAIEGAKKTADAVQDAIGHATESAVRSAKNALDIRHHVRHYPLVGRRLRRGSGLRVRQFLQPPLNDCQIG